MRRRFLNNIKSISSSNDYHSEYFTIEALEDGLTASLSTNACEYRIDNGSWNNLSANTNTPSINKGQTLSFRGNLTPTSSNGIGTFTISKKCNLKGNIMSLLYGDDFIDKTDLTGKDYAFHNLFVDCKTIVDASKLILPATTLADYCYQRMFIYCTSLTAAPALPATTLARYCYRAMFSNCSLNNAPELPATTLAAECYGSMFTYCTSLTYAPELPATKLSIYCYYNMFNGCSKLNYIKMLATDISASGCLTNWVQSVSRTGTFVKHPDMTSLPSGINGIPSRWTVVDNGSNLITFTIAGTEYQVEEGMTWADWVESVYNTDKFKVYNDNIVKYVNQLPYFVSINYNNVLKTDIIVNGAEYEYIVPGGGN
jgi:hypothetical protein